MKKISFAGPWITQKEIDSVTQAVARHWFQEFEVDLEHLIDAVSSYLGAKYVLPTHCCTHALHLACAALGLGEGDEVIVTDHSWVATAYAVTYTGAQCVFVDIDPQTLCIDPAAIEKAVTPKTKAIMMVHNFGVPADMDEIMAIAKRHNLKVIEDAAPALGAIYKGQKVGLIGDVGCFSFQGGKLAVSGEGGVLVTNNKAIYDRAALLCSMGRTDRIAPFWSDEVGFQYSMSNLAASLAAVQVERIEELVAKKREIHSWYYKRMAGHEKITMVEEKPNTRANYCYPSCFIREDSKVSRDEILRRFRDDLNIHGRPGFPRMSQFPAYVNDCRFANPVAERFEKYGFVFPSAADLTEEDADFVCNTLIGWL